MKKEIINLIEKLKYYGSCIAPVYIYSEYLNLMCRITNEPMDKFRNSLTCDKLIINLQNYL